MTISEALQILEDAVLQCTQRNINTSEVKQALDLLEPHILPAWLIPQFRQEAMQPAGDTPLEREREQQVLCAIFPRIRDSVRILLRKKMNRIACELIQTHNPNVREQLRCITREYGNLAQPWVFVGNAVSLRRVP
jgi:transposase-like protein